MRTHRIGLTVFHSLLFWNDPLKHQVQRRDGNTYFYEPFYDSDYSREPGSSRRPGYDNLIADMLASCVGRWPEVACQIRSCWPIEGLFINPEAYTA